MKINANQFKISTYSGYYQTKEEVKNALNNLPIDIRDVEISYNEFGAGKSIITATDFLKNYDKYE